MGQRLPFLTVEEFYQSYGKRLGLQLVRSKNGFSRRIEHPELNRPGLALSGFFDYFAEERIQVLGNAECSYLKTLPPEDARKRFSDLCWQAIPCIILARNHVLPVYLMDEAENAGVSVFQTSMASMQLVNAVTTRLLWAFAPTTSEHGSMVDIRGIGVLIKGESGSGKSETVMGLLGRGASLVADDHVQFRAVEGSEVVGTSPELGRYHMEVRGLGIINVAAIFGIGSVRVEKALNLVVHLTPETKFHELDRTGLDKKRTEILGTEFPYVEIPVAPGRDIAQLVEVAALDTKLKVFGHDAAVQFNEKLLRSIREHTDRTDSQYSPS